MMIYKNVMKQSWFKQYFICLFTSKQIHTTSNVPGSDVTKFGLNDSLKIKEKKIRGYRYIYSRIIE